MSLHTRPIPAPKTPTQVAKNHFVVHPARPEPQPAPPLTDGEPNELTPRAEPNPTPAARVEPAATDGSARPWYRSEPWLPVSLSAFVPLVAAVIAPDAAQYPLIGLSVVTLMSGVIMLVRQGLFRPRSGPGGI